MLIDMYHIGYLTDELTAAMAFYEEMFGAEVLSRTTNADGSLDLAFLRVGQTEVELIEPRDKARLNGQSGLILDHVGYCVPNIDAAVAELQAKGVKFATAEPYWNPLGHRAIFFDPSTTLGARLHLTQR